MAETCLDQRAQVATCEVSYCIMLGRSKSGAIECNNCNIPCTCRHQHHSLFAFIHHRKCLGEGELLGNPRHLGQAVSRMGS